MGYIWAIWDLNPSTPKWEASPPCFILTITLNSCVYSFLREDSFKKIIFIFILFEKQRGRERSRENEGYLSSVISFHKCPQYSVWSKVETRSSKLYVLLPQDGSFCGKPRVFVFTQNFYGDYRRSILQVLQVRFNHPWRYFELGK